MPWAPAASHALLLPLHGGCAGSGIPERKVKVRAGASHPNPQTGRPRSSPWWVWELLQAALQWGWRPSPCSLLSARWFRFANQIHDAWRSSKDEGAGGPPF